MSTVEAISLDVRPVGGALGAEVHGLDLAHIDAGVAAALNDALAEHLVLFLRGMSPSAGELRDLASLFGPLELHPYLPKVDDSIPEVCVLDTIESPKADIWHTDVTYSEHPPV